MLARLEENWGEPEGPCLLPKTIKPAVVVEFFEVTAALREVKSDWLPRAGTGGWLVVRTA